MISTIILMVAFIVTICAGIPIAAGLGISAMIALLYDGLPLFMMVQRMMTQINTFTVMAILFFMLSGEIMCKGKMTDNLVAWAESVVGWMKGGLAIAGGLAACFFSALSGSSAATCASIGSIMIDKMKERGYPTKFSGSVIASAGITGIVIPPSVTFVVYGTVTGTSVKKLFASGALPGILLSLSICLVSWYYSKKNDYGEVSKFNLKNFLAKTKDGLSVLMMPVIILGGIYSGLCTPNEAAVIACVYAYIITKFVDKALPWKVMREALVKFVRDTAVVVFVMQTASGFSWVLTNAGVPAALGRFCATVGDNRYVFLLGLNIVFLLAGMLITGSAAVSILAPIFLPVAVTYGIDPIHLGCIMIVNLAIGYITPPVGVNLYLAAGVSKTSIEDLIKQNMPFLLVSLLVLVIVNLVPGLSTWIPSLIK